MKKFVIYAIVNKVNGKMYIGSTINMKERKRMHIKKLNKGNHDSHHLQQSFNKYKEDSFSFIKLEEGDFTIEYSELLQKEEKWILLYDTISPSKGYNQLLPTSHKHLMNGVSHIQKGHENYLLTKGPIGVTKISKEEWIKRRIENPDFKLSYIPVEDPKYNKKKILKISPLDFTIIQSYNSIVECANQENLRDKSLRKVVEGNRKRKIPNLSTKGFIYLDEELYSPEIFITPVKEVIINKPQQICIVHSSGEQKEFNTYKQIAEFLNVKPNHVTELKKGIRNKGGGYFAKVLQIKGWRLKDNVLVSPI